MSFYDRERGRPGEPPLPKPYEFVPLATERPALRAPAGHHRYGDGLLSGEMRATLIARSPIHVASGLLEPRRDRDNPLVKALFRTNGHPVIPATSLKGCVRSIVEAISPSAVTLSKAYLPREAEAARSVERLDVTQRLFGMLGYQGNVAFADAPLLEGTVTIVRSVQLFRPRPESRGTYTNGERPKGRKFYMHGALAQGDVPLEVIAEGSSLSLLVRFTNVTPGELGLLLTGLGLGTSQFWPKLGGAKPACLGTLEVTAPTLVCYVPSAEYTTFAIAPQPLALAPLLEAARAEGLILAPQLQRLADILRWPREDRRCPERSY